MKLASFFVATVAMVSTAAFSSITWTVDTNGRLLKNGNSVVVHGFSTTCMEYLLRGIGVECMCTYNFNNPAQIISTLNRGLLDAMYAKLLPSPAGIQPSIRLTLNAGYYLDVVTNNWSANRNKFPGLSAQYVTLVESIVADATAKGVIVILDLHWNDDINEQQEMALKGTTTIGDSLTFWNRLSSKFANNPLVWYELYNEPHAANYDVWLNGNAKFEGMKAMAALVRANNIKGMILVAGAFGFAYDATSLIQFPKDTSVDRVMFVFHPYMGPLQQGDPGKNADGFATRLESVIAQTKRPVIMTEIKGACFQYGGNFRGAPMGYVRALLTEMQSTGSHWTAWAFRPGTGGDCNQPDFNDGTNFYNSASHSNLGANWASLFPTFYGALGQATPTAPPTFPPTQPRTNAPVLPPTLAPSQPRTNAPVVPPTQPRTNGPVSQPTIPTKTPTVLTKAPTATKGPTQAQTKVPTSTQTKVPTQTQATSTPTGVTATKTPTNEANIPPTVAPGGTDNNRFDIQLNFQPSAISNDALVLAVSAAAAKWMSVIVADFGTSVKINKGESVCGLPAASQDIIVDDLMIFVEVIVIDGPGKVRSNSGPCGFDKGQRIRFGIMQLDEADIGDLDILATHVMHGMGHVLGLGNEWQKRNFVLTPPTEYLASNGVQGHQEIGGTGRPQVEVTGSGDTATIHWKQSVYGIELMTSSLEGQIRPLSRLSVRALNDLGYTINADRADEFTISSNAGRRLRGEEEEAETRELQANNQWETAWNGPVAQNLVESPDVISAPSVVGPVVGGMFGVLAVASAFVLYKRMNKNTSSLHGSQLASSNPLWAQPPVRF